VTLELDDNEAAVTWAALRLFAQMTKECGEAADTIDGEFLLCRGDDDIWATQADGETANDIAARIGKPGR
jgi:hypothetical protein